MSKLNNSIQHNRNHQKKLTIDKKIILAIFLSLSQPIFSNNTINDKESKYSSINNYGEISVKQQLARIVNFDKLGLDIQNSLAKELVFWEAEMNRLQIPKHMRIPLESLYITDNTNQINIITKFRNIHYFPSLSLIYQLSIVNFEFYKKYGKDSPTLSMICGLLSQETGIRNIKSYGNENSKGYGQLNYHTAEALLKKDPPKYNKYFYLKDGEIIFQGNSKAEQEKNMIAMVYILLIEEKGFKYNNELISIAKYNGSQRNINRYAIPVLKKAVKYATFFATVNNNHLIYEQEIQPIEHLIIDEGEKLGQKITPEIIRDVFSKQAMYTQIWRQNPKKDKEKKMDDIYIPPIYGSFNNINIDEHFLGAPYIIPEKGKTIFSYFRENTRDAVEYHNNISTNDSEKIEIFCYNIIGNKKVYHKIESKQEMIDKYKSGYMIYATPNRNKIYIDPQKNLYYYEGTEDRVTTIYYDLDK